MSDDCGRTNPFFLYVRNSICKIFFSSEKILVYTICTIYDFTDSGNTAAELYFIRKTKTFKQLESFDNPCNIFTFWNCMAYFRFQAIPDSTLDAARMDGVNQLQMIRYIIVPNSKPAVITLFILVFTESWNMVEQPILFLEKETDYPLSVFLASLNQNAVGIQSVCGLLCLLPVTFFFLYYNTELTDGLKDILWS